MRPLLSLPYEQGIAKHPFLLLYEQIKMLTMFKAGDIIIYESYAHNILTDKTDRSYAIWLVLELGLRSPKGFFEPEPEFFAYRCQLLSCSAGQHSYAAWIRITKDLPKFYKILSRAE